MTNEEWSTIVNEYSNNKLIPKKIRECYDSIKIISESVGLSRPFLISNSMIFLHKYLIYNFFKNKNFFTINTNISFLNICISCFFITTKSTGYTTHLNVILENLLKKNNNLEKSLDKNEVFLYEYDILNAIGFNLENDLPYKYAKYIWSDLEKLLNNKKININIIKDIKEKWNCFILYSYLFPFFLKFDANIIALANLKIILSHYDIEINLSEIISHHKEFEFTSNKDIEVCSTLIDRLIINNDILFNINNKQEIGVKNADNQFKNIIKINYNESNHCISREYNGKKNQ